jgi:glycerophosphoryl diester phosphodiesterase
MPNAPVRFERIAHRGAPTERVENTLPGFLLALERGADAIELDVHVSGDGVPVVHHDAVAREHPIANSTWRDLARVTLDQDERIPRLQDVLEVIGGRATVYIELKGSRGEDEVISVARKYGQRYAMHSFDHAAMTRVARRAPGIPRGVLLDKGVAEPVRELHRAIGRVLPRDVWPHWSLVNREFMLEASELALRVIPWTVNSSEAAQNLLTLGAEGICTDDVRILANL